MAANESFMTNKSLTQTANGKQMPRKSAISIRENHRDKDKRLTKVRE